MTFDPASPCCATLADVLAGPGDGAEPMVFVNEDDALMMTIGVVDTPGGLGFFEHAVHYCPFCGTALQSVAVPNPKAMN